MAYTHGGEYPITATATNITDALGLVERQHCSMIIIRNATGATAPLYLGNSDVTTTTNRHAQIAAGEEQTLSGGGDTYHINTDEVFLVGTVNAANIAFITLIS